MGRIRSGFYQDTEKSLREAFRKAYLRVPSRVGRGVDWAASADRAATIFVRCLARFADGESRFRAPPEQRDRRDNLKALANSLDRCLDAVLKTDDSALTYAFLRGIEETMRAQGIFNPAEHKPLSEWDSYPAPIAVMAGEWKSQHAEEFRVFVNGVRKATDELPEIDGAERSFEQHTPRQTARWLELYLESQFIPFTTSDTGLAGIAFDAVMQLVANRRKENCAQGQRARAERQISAQPGGKQSAFLQAMDG